jgi:hypothetical protein
VDDPIVFEAGTGGSLTITVDGGDWDYYWWYHFNFEGNPAVSHGDDVDSHTILVDTFFTVLGPHTVTVVVRKDGVLYSQEITYTVVRSEI